MDHSRPSPDESAYRNVALRPHGANLQFRRIFAYPLAVTVEMSASNLAGSARELLPCLNCIQLNRYRPSQSLGLDCSKKDCFEGQSINEVGGRCMSKQAAEHHRKAAEHHAHLARAHHEVATHHAVEAAKAHLEEHGKASPAHA